MKLRHTLIFLNYQNKCLLINKEKGFWMGRWNGVGGKIEIDETPLECAIRETYEETGIRVKKLVLAGIVSWHINNELGGMYVYIGKIDNLINTPYYSPSNEGIIDLKSIEWIMDQSNLGIASNIPIFLPKMLKLDQTYYFHCDYDGNDLKKCIELPFNDIKMEILG